MKTWINEFIDKFKENNQFKIAIFLQVIALILCFVITWIISKYISPMITAGMIVVEIIALILFYLLNFKKTTVGMIVHIFLVLVLILSMFPIIRVSNFGSAITNTMEEDFVQVITKTDSTVQATDDFIGYRIAIIKDDPYTNWGLQLLKDKNKTTGLVEVDYQTYEEAYKALMNDEIELMFFSSACESSLEETNFADHFNHRVLFEEKKQIEIDKLPTVDLTKNGFTVLISGVDLSGTNINKKGRSDVIILATINPNTKKVHLQSVPRDIYAALPCRANLKTKINRSGSQGGINCTIEAVENYFDIDINYYTKINFTGFTDLIDSLGGISAYSQYNYCTGEYCFYQGMNEMDGAKALIFARIRKILPENDVSRGKNQLEIIKGIINKFAQEPSFDRMMNIMNSIEKNFVTSFSEKDFIALFNMFMNMKDDMEITSDSIKGEIFWDDDPIYHEYLYYYQPYKGEKELVKERIENILNGK